MATTVLAREIAWLEPVAAFEAVRGLPWPVFLDSARADARLGRWSYVAADPFLRLTSKDGRITLGERSFTGDPFAVLQRALAHYRLAHDPALPVPFQTGVVGYLGYDLAHHLERLPHPALDDLSLPDLAAGFYDAVLAFDGSRAAGVDPVQRLAGGDAGGEHASHGRRGRTSWRGWWRGRASRRRCRRWRARSWCGRTSAGRPTRRRCSGWSTTSWPATSSRPMSRSGSRRSCPDGLDAWGLYRRLRRRNPAPFAALLDFGEVAIASASPERFLELRGRQVETRPIKGTRPRAGARPRRTRGWARSCWPAPRTGPRT